MSNQQCLHGPCPQHRRVKNCQPHICRVLVNVVKYKLDHMRRRIETDERDSTNRASFRCPCCLSTFTDLEANQLFDPMTGKQ